MSDNCILQIEDEEADIFLLKHVFDKAGITSPVRAVTNGQMAIDYLAGIGVYADRAQYPLPCLVLLDLKLPKISGLEVLEWVAGSRTSATWWWWWSVPHACRWIWRAYDWANSYIQSHSTWITPWR